MAVSNLAIRVFPETLRSVAFGSIGASYSAIGSAFSNPVHVFFLQNLTDVELKFSWDGINDHFVLGQNGYVIIDITTNKTSVGGSFMIAAGTICYVKRSAGAPSAGNVYLTILTGQGA